MSDSKHAIGPATLEHIIKPLAVAGGTIAVSIPVLMSDGNLSSLDLISAGWSALAAVCALYIQVPGSKNQPNG